MNKNAQHTTARAFADSSGWNAEVRTLRCLGYPVVAAPNPLRV
ncbi:hypothetical protein [Dactylosporangium sp. CA-233914]